MITASVAAWARWRGDARTMFAAFVVFPLSLLTLGFDGIRLYADKKSARSLADRLPALPAGTEIACLECFSPGLPFYSKRLVTVISEDGADLASNYIVFFLKKTKPWPARVVPLEERDRWLASRDRPVYLLARSQKVDQLKSIATASGVTVTNISPSWWAALFPAPGGT